MTGRRTGTSSARKSQTTGAQQRGTVRTPGKPTKPRRTGKAIKRKTHTARTR